MDTKKVTNINKLPDNMRILTVMKDTKTRKIFAGPKKNYDGVTLERGKVYLVEKNDGFGSNNYDYLVKGFVQSNLVLTYAEPFLLNTKDKNVVFV